MYVQSVQAGTIGNSSRCTDFRFPNLSEMSKLVGRKIYFPRDEFLARPPSTQPYLTTRAFATSYTVRNPNSTFIQTFLFIHVTFSSPAHFSASSYFSTLSTLTHKLCRHARTTRPHPHQNVNTLAKNPITYDCCSVSFLRANAFVLYSVGVGWWCWWWLCTLCHTYILPTYVLNTLADALFVFGISFRSLTTLLGLTGECLLFCGMMFI